MTKTYRSYAGYGVDVAEHRADDLDRMMLDYVTSKPACQVLDIGCGAGGMAIKMANQGAQVTAIDTHDFSQQFLEWRKNNPRLANSLVFKQVDTVSFVQSENHNYAAVLFQRTLHYLPYVEAVEVLRLVRSKTSGRLFVSVTGMASAAATSYPGVGVALPKRMNPLAPEQAELFSMHHPVCLYTQSEFVLLLVKAGWKVDQVWTSAFGNHKAVCSV